MDELRSFRRRKVEEKRPALVREFLHEVYTSYLAGDLDPMPHGVVLMLIGEDGPSAHWSGGITTPELKKALWEFGDAIREQRPYPSPEEAEEIRHRQEEYEKTHPWACDPDVCRQRFKTQRGLAVHQRSCRLRAPIDPQDK